jgi:hypothetical protein
MAEIEIEKKKPIWPWIIVALVIAAIIYFLAFAEDDTIDDMAVDTTEMVTDDKSQETDTFINTQENNTYDATSDGDANALMALKSHIDNPKMGLDHEYTNEALLKLIVAVKNKATILNVDVDADLMEAKKKAEDITEDPYEVDHANKIRNSGEIIVKAIKTIQTKEFPNLSNSFDTVNESLMRIKPDEKTLNQKADVNNFFEQAAELLTQMNK